MLLLFGGWFHVSYQELISLYVSALFLSSLLHFPQLCNGLNTVQSNKAQVRFVRLFSLIYVPSHLTGLRVEIVLNVNTIMCQVSLVSRVQCRNVQKYLNSTLQL